MKVIIDKDLCISCGYCIDLCPKVFDWDDEGFVKVIVDEVPGDLEESARTALGSCPSTAIREE